jgi:hypothetical protein
MNWVDVETASKILEIGKDTIYCESSRDKKFGLHDRFKNDGRNLKVNVEKYHRNKPTYETQKNFEDLYFELIDILPSKRKFYQMVANIIGKNERAVCVYFFDMFNTGSEKTKLKYVNAMQQIKQGLI